MSAVLDATVTLATFIVAWAAMIFLTRLAVLYPLGAPIWEWNLA